MLSNYEMTQYGKTLDAIFSGAGSKGEKTLGRWCDRARAVAGAVDVLRDDSMGKFKKDEAQYSTQKNNERWEKMQEECNIFVDLAKEKLMEDLESVLDAKRTAFSKAMGAPDAESLRLLQTLAMREKIGAAEIAATAEHLAGNLQSLSVLRELAIRNDIAFPRLNTDYLDTESQVRAEAERTISNILVDPKDRGYDGRNFLIGSGDFLNGSMRGFVEDLDNPAWLACNVSQIEDMPRVLKNAVYEGAKEALDGGEKNEQTESSFDSFNDQSDF